LFGNTNFNNYSSLKIYNNIISGDVNCLYSCGGMLGSVGYQGADSVLNAFVWANLMMVLNVTGVDEIGGMVGHLAFLSFWDVEYGYFRDIKVEGKMYTGGIVGFTAGALEVNESNIDTVHVIGTDYVGGLSGNHEEQILEVRNSIIKRLYVDGANFVGGFAGRVSGGTQFMDISTEQLKVNGQDNVGGLFGFADIVSIPIYDSIFQTVVTGENNVGGLVGLCDSQLLQFRTWVNTWVNGFNKVGGIAGEHKDYTIYIEDSAITGLISQNHPNESETDPTYIGGLVGTGEGLIGIANTYTFTRILPQAESNTIAGIYSGYMDLINPDYGSMIYWNESLDPIQLTSPDSTPSNDVLMSEAFDYFVDDNNELIFAIIPEEDDNGTIVDKVYTLASIMGMESCTVKISITPENTYACYTIPYPADINELIMERACIPYDMQEEVCATTSPYSPDIPDFPAPDDDDDNDNDDDDDDEIVDDPEQSDTP
jgi:hypothetical protein